MNGVKKLPESMSPRGEIGHALFREQQDARGGSVATRRMWGITSRKDRPIRGLGQA